VVTLKRRLAPNALALQGLADRLVDRLVDDLPSSQRRIIVLMREKPSSSKKQMADSLGISTTAVDKNIAQLKRKGFVRRIGPDKGGHWEVKK
jgi:ATP-dependent DNA helicase RecG